MSNETHGFSGQFGNATAGSGTVYELTDWKGTPTQKLGDVVSNFTKGFTGQVVGAQGFSGTLTVLVPKDATGAPFRFGMRGGTKLYLAADENGTHTITVDTARIASAPISVGLGDDKGVTMEFEFKADGNVTGTGMFDVFNNSGNSDGNTPSGQGLGGSTSYDANANQDITVDDPDSTPGGSDE